MSARTKAALVLMGVLVSIAGIGAGILTLREGRDEVASEQVDLGPVIARVDGRPIYLHEARMRIEGLSSVHGDIEEMLGDDWPDRILRSLVADQVLRAEAAARGIEVTAADIDAYVRQVTGTIGTGQTLDEWLAAQGMTMAELERRAELQILGGRVYLAVTADVRVTGRELRTYYREHRQEFEEVDGTIPPLLEIRRSLRRSLLDAERDEAYAAWLEEARDRAEVVVVMDDWWRNL